MCENIEIFRRKWKITNAYELITQWLENDKNFYERSKSHWGKFEYNSYAFVILSFDMSHSLPITFTDFIKSLNNDQMFEKIN